MSADLLFEVGTEEIPAEFLRRALDEIATRGQALLAEARLEVGRVTALGTPRRLVLAASAVADRQPDLSERVVGPPARVAFDGDGNPTKAAEGFARRNQVELSALERAEVEGKKGEYVVCTRHEPGRPAAEVLPGLLERLLTELPWPKSMRWGSREEAFVRPVHWIVALFGDTCLPVSFAGVEAGRRSRGHRFLAPGEVEVESALGGYCERLRRAFVVVEPQARREMIEAELARVESETGARVRPDPELVAEVTNLVEYPAAVCGSFEEAFLEVPEEVIVSAMRSHQRYFALEDEQGRLVNRFATIAGTVTRDPEVVRAGNERVLAARLADARFFFREDQKRSLDERAGKLSEVVFQSRLGSIGAKVGRVTEIVRALAAEVGVDPALAARAAALCKADLVTQMVFEFPELQGVMGRHYARMAGEPEAVSEAIYEHYLPRGAGDELPTSDLGAALGVADRIDTLVGCFAVGLGPTGSADPYGLRRAALGILGLLLDRGWAVSLSTLVDRAAAALAGTAEVDGACREQVLGFLRTRLKGMLGELPADCVEAALTIGYDDVPDARARAQAVAELRRRDDFEPLGVAFKRVANILKDTDAAAAPAPDRFVEDEERALWRAFGDIESQVDEHLGSSDYGRALAVLAELKDPVDRFFDKVLVMDEDPAVRANRLALLARIGATFARIADFRQISV
ncbi:glycine--tRNA ligase subunit beta [Haliangium sp.]|uniref:glycine--tRNA ligase subunit beta n=1 Tax=Haliangium sp. TaxID=2663208 RepID=UPI003D0E1BC7